MRARIGRFVIAVGMWLAARLIDGLIAMQEWFDHQNGVCPICSHGEHLPAKCGGDPRDRSYSSPAGIVVEAQGCLCGDPEFAP